MSYDRKLVTKKRMVLTRRMTKWAGFTHDFGGQLSSDTWTGYKTENSSGELTVHLWRNTCSG
jgi:hypothetical protein